MIDFNLFSVCSYAMGPADNNESDNDDENMAQIMADPDVMYIAQFINDYLVSKNIDLENAHPFEIIGILQEAIQQNPEIQARMANMLSDPQKAQMLHSVMAKSLPQLLSMMSKGMPQNNQQVVISTTKVEYTAPNDNNQANFSAENIWQTIFSEIYDKNTDCNIVAKNLIRLCTIKMSQSFQAAAIKNPSLKQTFKQSENFKNFVQLIDNFNDKYDEVLPKVIIEFPYVVSDINPVIKDMNENLKKTITSLEKQATITAKKLIAKNFLKNYGADTKIINLFDSISNTSDLFLQFGKITIVIEQLNKIFNTNNSTNDDKKKSEKKTEPKKSTTNTKPKSGKKS